MREEEEALRQQILAKFAEDDRIEQLNAQKRRMKQLEHKMAVEKILEDRRKQCIAEKVRVSHAPLVWAECLIREYLCYPKGQCWCC